MAGSLSECLAWWAEVLATPEPERSWRIALRGEMRSWCDYGWRWDA